MCADSDEDDDGEEDDDSEENKKNREDLFERDSMNLISDDEEQDENDALCSKEKKKIFDKLFSQTGVDLFSNQRVASQIPADFFMRRSTIALEDDANFLEVVYEPPVFKQGKDYYSKFWTSFVENERILGEIQDIAKDNLKSLTAIYSMEDFYENNLLPKMFAFPH